MTLYGYARVSTGDQDLSLQEAALWAAGCQVIRSEKKTGTQREGRTEFDILLQFLRKGDTLVITRIDRLARSLKDLQDFVHELKSKGVTLKATEQPVDTSTAADKAFFGHAGRVCRVRDEPSAREADGGDSGGQGAVHLHRARAQDRPRRGSPSSCRGEAQPSSHRQTARDRALLGVPVPARGYTAMSGMR